MISFRHYIRKSFGEEMLYAKGGMPPFPLTRGPINPHVYMAETFEGLHNITVSPLYCKVPLASNSQGLFSLKGH